MFAKPNISKIVSQINVQLWVLLIISVIFLTSAPSLWRYAPDSGIYIGTAENMVATGRFDFNGYPNLKYYPGFSSLLSLPIAIFGLNFRILHLFCALIVVASLWLVKLYFPPSQYGPIGLWTPIIFSCCGILQKQIFYILSDATYLVVSFGALLCWRLYEDKDNRFLFFVCYVLISFAPLVRFDGLCLCVAFAATLLFKAFYERKSSPLRVLLFVIYGVGTLIPFAFWTLRNYLQFTPDTFNLANEVFFGQAGLRVYYTPDHYRFGLQIAEWEYGLLNAMLFLNSLGTTIFGSSLASRFPVQLIFIFIYAALSFGLLLWFKRASYLERLYLILSFLFLIYISFKSHSLYVVSRYWLPILPFILVAVGLCFKLIYQKLQDTPLHTLYYVIICILVVLALSNGVNNILVSTSKSQSEFYENANDVIIKIKQFVDNNSSEDISVATTDWGVMPFILKRKCYQILNDSSHLMTLKRMNKYQTSYLVILDDLAVFPKFAREMVKDLPDLFELVLDVVPKGNGPRGSVYKVDLHELQEYLADKEMSHRLLFSPGGIYQL